MSVSGKGTLFLIPVPLGESVVLDILPQSTIDRTRELKFFIAENAKTARQFLKKMEMPLPLQEITVIEIDKHSHTIDFGVYFEALRNGQDTGLVSEAGMPAVADPGSQFVMQAHREGIKVVPLTGPSSILLAIAASGLNGQSFTFHGYLPKEKDMRIDKIKLLDSNAKKFKQTQIFIETPYRNQPLLDDLLTHCSPSTLLCIATDISLSSEQIKTLPISEWRKVKVDINKRPTVFLIL